MKLSLNLESGTTYQVQFDEAPLQLYRMPHDIERRNYNLNDKTLGCAFMGDGYRSGPVRNAVMNDPSNPTKKPMPEVYRIYPDHQTLLPCRWVTLWRNMNSELSVKQFGTLMDTRLAWMNNTGTPERRNCLTGENMEAKDPAFDAARLCGGAIVKTRSISNGIAYLESMLTSDTVPTADWVIARPWLWYWGTAVTRTGQVNRIMRTGLDGQLKPVRIPFLTRLPVYVPLSWLDPLTPGFLPPATWMAG